MEKLVLLQTVPLALHLAVFDQHVHGGPCRSFWRLYALTPLSIHDTRSSLWQMNIELFGRWVPAGIERAVLPPPG